MIEQWAGVEIAAVTPQHERDRMTATLDRTVTPVASVDAIRAHFPGARAHASRLSRRVLRRPGRHAGAARRRRRDGRVSLSSQRQHALALSDERRDRRADRRRAPDARRFRERPRRRDRVRPEHDVAHLPPRARDRPRAGARATRSSSPSSITTATSRPGARSQKDRGVTVRMVQDAHERRSARLERPRGGDHAAHQECSPSARRRTRSARSPTSRARLRLARSVVGARVFVDAVHYAPHNLVDVAAARLRFPRLLGVQVLRPAHRRSLGQARADRIARRTAARAGAAGIARAARDGHAESRRNRRRGGRGRFPRVARRHAPLPGPTPTAATHFARRSTRCTHAASAARQAVEFARRDRRAHVVRSQARHAAHADAVLHAARLHDRRRRELARQARRVRLQRRLLRRTVIERSASCPTARARRLQLLHERETESIDCWMPFGSCGSGRDATLSFATRTSSPAPA